MTTKFYAYTERNELCEKCVCLICILLYCSLWYLFLTVATFPATYIQQLGRSLQKNEKLVTVCLSRSNFALIHLSQRNTPASKKYTRLKEIHPPQRNTPASKKYTRLKEIHPPQRNTPASKKYTRLKEIHPPQRNTPASKKYTRLKEIHLHMEHIIC
jgi:hypothetical protein